MLTKTSKWYKTEALNNDAEYHKKRKENKTPKPTVSSYFRCYLRYYGQNDMAETGFNGPMYLILLRYNAIIRNPFICTTSRLYLI